MSVEENKALIRRYFEAIDAECKSGHANADMLDEFLAADLITLLTSLGEGQFDCVLRFAPDQQNRAVDPAELAIAERVAPWFDINSTEKLV